MLMDEEQLVGFDPVVVRRFRWLTSHQDARIVTPPIQLNRFAIPVEREFNQVWPPVPDHVFGWAPAIANHYLVQRVLDGLVGSFDETLAFGVSRH